MLKGFILAGAFVAFCAAPALADESCGTAPLAPAVPSAADVKGKAPDDAHKIILDTLHNVKSYQTTLGTYRNCLMVQTNAAKADMAEAQAKGDKTKADTDKQQLDVLQKSYDGTVDTETQVVTDYSTLHAAYCALGSNLAGCPTTH